MYSCADAYNAGLKACQEGRPNDPPARCDTEDKVDAFELGYFNGMPAMDDGYSEPWGRGVGVFDALM